MNNEHRSLFGARPAATSLFFLLIFDTIRFFSIFFRRWANLVAGLRAVCRPLPAIVGPLKSVIISAWSSQQFSAA